jgi:hypothetical protein
MCIEGLKKTAKMFSMDSLSIGQDSNVGPSVYEAAVVTALSFSRSTAAWSLLNGI